MLTRQGVLERWVDLLPSPWDKDPFVVYVQVPERAKTFRKDSRVGGYSFTTVELDGREWGLQVLKPSTPKLSEQMYLFRRAGLRMMDPAFVGRLSDIPNKMLAMEGHHMVFQRDEMSASWINLRAYFMPNGTDEERKAVWQ